MTEPNALKPDVYHHWHQANGVAVEDDCFVCNQDTIVTLRGHLASSRERVTQLMATSDKERAICKDALDTYGVSAQLQVAMEECGELVVAISHYLRGRDNALEALAEEIADVEVMCVQLRAVVGGSFDVDAIKAAKWERLSKRLEGK